MLRWLRAQSLQAKILGLMSLCLLLILIATNMFSWYQLRHSLDEQVIDSAQQVVGPSQAILIENLMPTGDTPLIQQTLEQMINPNVKDLTVYRPDGRATFTADPAKRGKMQVDPELKRILSQEAPQIRWGEENGERILLSYTPIKANETCVDCHPGVKPGDVRGFIEMKLGTKDSDAILFRQVTSNALVTFLLFGLLLAGLALIVSRTLIAPIKRMTAIAQAVSRGDLDQQIAVTSDDEVGKMARSFQEMVANLNRIVGQVRAMAQAVAAEAERIRQGTEQMANASRTQEEAVERTSRSMEDMAASIAQVAGSAQSLSAGVETTSSSIDEMASSIQQVAHSADYLSEAVSQSSASIEEMAAAIRQVALNVREAESVAEQSTGVAHEGSQAVSQTIAGMQRITSVMTEVVTVIEGLGKRSAEIGEIVEVIDDIAEQTNLLALNAAIEAARAGEHGRGFAVVADEVRKLAERSSKATGEIAKLIQGIQRETEKAISSTQQGETVIHEGTQLANAAGTTIGQMVSSSDRVSALMGQIALAAEEQTKAAAQITEAMERMNTLTGQVASATREQAKGSEQIVEAIESMSTMTHQVTEATTSQKAGGEQVLRAVDRIQQAVHDSSQSTVSIAASATDLAARAQELMEAIAFFKAVSSPSTPEVVERVVPSLPASSR